MPCEYVGKCVTRATMQQLDKSLLDKNSVYGNVGKYMVTIHDGDKGFVSPHEMADLGNMILNGEYCHGDPTMCQAWKDMKGVQ